MAILFDYSNPSNPNHTHGPCTYNNGTEIFKGPSSTGTVVTYAPPTNPYNLP